MVSLYNEVYTYILELKVLYFYPSSVLVTTSLSLHIHMDTHCFSGVSTEMNIVVSKKGWVLILARCSRMDKCCRKLSFFSI